MSDTRFTRSGETEYASIHRNRSGASSGEIDYGWSPFFCQDNLSDGDKQALVDTCFALYETMCHYLEKQAKNDARHWRPIEEVPEGVVILMCDVHGNRWTGLSEDLGLDWGCGYPALYWQHMPEPPKDA